jgi:hypothetical protein
MAKTILICSLCGLVPSWSVTHSTPSSQRCQSPSRKGVRLLFCAASSRPPSPSTIRRTADGVSRRCNMLSPDKRCGFLSESLILPVRVRARTEIVARTPRSAGVRSQCSLSGCVEEAKQRYPRLWRGRVSAWTVGQPPVRREALSPIPLDQGTPVAGNADTDDRPSGCLAVSPKENGLLHRPVIAPRRPRFQCGVTSAYKSKTKRPTYATVRIRAP